MIKEPIGYRIIGVVEDLGETASKGSKIVIPDNVRAKEKLATQVAYVKLIGPKETYVRLIDECPVRTHRQFTMLRSLHDRCRQGQTVDIGIVCQNTRDSILGQSQCGQLELE